MRRLDFDQEWTSRGRVRACPGPNPWIFCSFQKKWDPPVLTSLSRSFSFLRELPAVLIRLAASSLSSSSAPIPRLLILAHKTDLLARTSGSGTSPTAVDDKAKTTAIERAKLILTREMDRLKSARGTTSGRIEGIDAVPLTSTSSSFFGLGRFFRSGRAGSKPTVLSEEGMDEAELMVWGQNGRFKWEEIEGVDVQWAASGMAVQAPGKTEGKQDGLEDVRNWLSDL